LTSTGNRTIIRLLLAVLPVIAGCIGVPAGAQDNPVDTTQLATTRPHSIRRATILAATLPGAGQAYNRKYWKIPIVYAGYAGGSFALITNQRNYKQSKTDYLALTDDDPATVYEGTRSKEMLLSDIDRFRRFRDMSVLGLIAWHLLSVIDANVDAHFFYWDIDEDLSLNLTPGCGMTKGFGSFVGLNLTFKIN